MKKANTKSTKMNIKEKLNRIRNDWFFELNKVWLKMIELEQDFN